MTGKLSINEVTSNNAVYFILWRGGVLVVNQIIYSEANFAYKVVSNSKEKKTVYYYYYYYYHYYFFLTEVLIIINFINIFQTSCHLQVKNSNI